MWAGLRFSRGLMKRHWMTGVKRKGLEEKREEEKEEKEEKKEEKVHS